MTDNREPSADDAPAHRYWDDATFRTKLILLIALAALAGCLVGLAEAASGHRAVILSVGLTAVSGAVTLLAHHWILRPLQRLLEHLSELSQLSQHDDRDLIRTLAASRGDEIGQLAHLCHGFAAEAIRHQIDAVQLRRTIDDRVARKTRLATKKLRKLSMRDPMTDLGNRRFLDEHLEPLVQSVQISGYDLVCVSIDMDNFKKINDTLGHNVGDQLIIFLGGLIRGTTREEDYAIRLGGDEFAILMPNCPFDRVRQFCQRLRELFQQYVQISLPAEIKVDLSCGVASLRRDRIDDGRRLLEKADDQLYDAKRAGKGCSVGI